MRLPRPLLAAILVGGLVASALTGSRLAAQALSLKDFVRQVHYHGVSYGEARRYPSSAVPVLLRMLADPANAPHWTNIVAVLGIIGDQSVVARLIAFAHQGSGTLTPDEYRAKSTVLIALGYVANHTGSRAALDYLLASANPEAWNARALRWSSPFHATSAARNARLSSTAFLGLALSGAPAAGNLLRSLATGARSPPAQQAFAEFQTITRLGLARYYARPGIRD